jgi:predicted nucleic acid-binding protein
MPELVINTGPLIALCAALEELAVLKSCYHSLCVPHVVAQELSAGPNGSVDLDRIMAVGIFEVARQPVTLSPFLASSLDPGEASVIATAVQLGINKVAIDEKIGRRIARLHGLSVTGSTGMLLKCAKTGAIPDLQACFETMRLKGIWVSEAITREALAQLGR